MQDIKQRIALSSILASGGLTVAKAAVGVASGSLAILSEAAHSLLDFVATVVTYFAVRVSGKPADEEHHYGHGKVESVAALATTALLFLLSGIVTWEGINRLFFGEVHAIEPSIWTFGVIGGSILIDFFRARALYRVAEETSSEALEADALHFGSDMWSSIAVLVGLGAVVLGFPWADALAAMVVAVFVCLAGWRLGYRTVETLTDTAPPGISAQIEAAAAQVSGVVGVERIRARPVGNKLFVDLALVVSRTAPLDQVTLLKNEVTSAIQAVIPSAEVVLTTEGRALDTETILDRVMVIARNQGVAVHHVTVHSIGDHLAVAIDIEVDGVLSLREAHDIASALETAVRDELGPEAEVETHIEPLEPSDSSGREADPSRIEEVTAALIGIAAQSSTIHDIHDVRVRHTDGGEIVNFHCYVDADRSVQTTHENVDDIERELKRRVPGIKRVIGHAEPKG